MNNPTFEHDVLIGIVTYNRKTKLATTLDACRKQGFENIVVVDNGSADGTREYLLQQRGVVPILNDKNEGGSGGFNRVMKYFIHETSCRWLLTFDDDAYPLFSSSELRNYLNRGSHLNAPALALRVTYRDGTLCEMNRPGVNILNRNPFRSWIQDFHVGEGTTSCAVDFASFVGLVLRRETVEKVGFVSSRFFVYSDDTYYTLSISSKLGRIRYCPDFVLVHDCQRSSRKLANHDVMRRERDIINKMVMIREYSEFKALYIAIYVARLIVLNPWLFLSILRASRKGVQADLAAYRNEPVSRPFRIAAEVESMSC